MYCHSWSLHPHSHTYQPVVAGVFLNIEIVLHLTIGSNILLIQHSPPQSFFILQLKHSPPSLTFSTSNIVLLPTFSFSNILLVEHSHCATFYSSNILLILKHSLPRMFSFANIWIRRKLISV